MSRSKRGFRAGGLLSAPSSLLWSRGSVSGGMGGLTPTLRCTGAPAG